MAILNVLVKNLRLHRPSHRFFYFFGIVRELLAKARTLNFVAPVEVLWGFSKVDVLRSRRVDTRDDVRKNLHFILQIHENLFKIWSKIQYDKLSETRWVRPKGAGVEGMTPQRRMGLHWKPIQVVAVHHNPLACVFLNRFGNFLCVFVRFFVFWWVFARFCVFWDVFLLLGRSWSAPGRSWDALGAL